jgi:predicted nucleic acid-binding protein
MGIGPVELSGTCYIDTSVLIQIVEHANRATREQVAFADAVSSRQVLAFSSDLTLSECLVHPFRDRNEVLAQLYVDVFELESDINPLPVTRDILVEAARQRSLLKVKTPDAIHIATAKLAGCECFVTNDQKLAAAFGSKAILWDKL